MKLKKLLSIIMVAAISLTALCYPLLTSAKVDYSYKIDSPLAEKLDKMDDDDTTLVSVWVSDIDYEIVKRRTNTVLVGKVSKDIIDAVNDIECSNNDSFFQLFEREINMSKKEIKKETEKIQLTISEKRKIVAEMQKANYQKIIKRFPKTISEQNIVYFSKFVPNMEMKLTKKQIYNLISIESVEKIYYINREKTSDLLKANSLFPKSTPSDQLNETIFDYTGINDLKNNYDLTGDGVKVGNIDWYFPDDTLDCFYDANNDNRLNLIDSIPDFYGPHEKYTTAIMIGKVNGVYEGICPGVDMYCVATGNPNEIDPDDFDWKSRIDTLIKCGVNIINSSFEAIGDGRNNYGDSAKWIDAMINSTNVSFVQSSADDTVDSVISGGMAYNSIVVGNYDMENNRINQTCSSYNSGNGTYKQYKPDIAAPGDIKVYYSQNDYSTNPGGTSGAAPVVTGIAALLCERYPYFLANPAFLKTSLLNGAHYLGVENTANSLSSFVAFDRQSGAGVVDGKRSRIDYTTMHWIFGTHNYLTNNYTIVDSNFGTLIVTPSLKPIHITVCSLKPLTQPNYTANIGYATFKITVTKGTNTWVSECVDDNKCSLRFTPQTQGTYKVKIERTDTNTINTKFALLYSSE